MEYRRGRIYVGVPIAIERPNEIYMEFLRKGASRGMYKSMSKKELRKLAKNQAQETTEEEAPLEQRTKTQRVTGSFAQDFCITSSTCLKGSVLTFLFP